MAAATALIRHAKKILQILQQGGTLLRLRAQKVDPENLQHCEIRMGGKFCEDKSQESSGNLTFNYDPIHNSSF